MSSSGSWLRSWMAVIVAASGAVGHGAWAQSSLQINGFADVGLRAASRTSGSGSGAYLGSLDLYMTPQIGERGKALVELVFEVNAQGEMVADLERLQVGWTVCDALTVWIGRFHTPFGYWNTAYHHGAQLQTSATRPTFLGFEDDGGVLPMHSVGVWGNGGFKLASGRIRYDAYLANAPTLKAEDGPASGVLNAGLEGSEKRRATVGGNASFEFTRGPLEGLQFGMHGLTSRVGDTFAQPTTTRLVVFGPWFAYQLADRWEVLGEWYEIRTRGDDGGRHGSRAAYVQAGRAFGAFTPFARLERARLDQAAAYFGRMHSGQSYRRAVVGLRYDIDPSSAVKLEASRMAHTDRDLLTSNELRLQWAVRF